MAALVLSKQCREEETWSLLQGRRSMNKMCFVTQACIRLGMQCDIIKVRHMMGFLLQYYDSSLRLH